MEYRYGEFRVVQEILENEGILGVPSRVRTSVYYRDDLLYDLKYPNIQGSWDLILIECLEVTSLVGEAAFLDLPLLVNRLQGWQMDLLRIRLRDRT